MLMVFHQKQTDGFTLIECIIVTAIIGILAAIAVPKFLIYRNQSRIAAATGSVDTIRAALAAYAASAPGTTYPSGTDIADYPTLVTLLNRHGTSLKPTASEQGFDLRKYSPESLGSPGTFEDYTISFVVKGISPGVKGSIVVASPTGTEPTS